MIACAKNTNNVRGLLVDSSENTLASSGTKEIELTTACYGQLGGGCVWDDDNNTFIFNWRNNSTNKGTYNSVTFDGTSLSKGTEGIFNNANSHNITASFDEDTKTTILTYRDSGDGNDGTSIVMVPEHETLKTKNFIGFAQAAYSNAATAKISVVGNQSTHSSLTPAATYYVQTNGTISTTAGSPSVVAGIALSSTKLLIKG